MWRLLGDFIHGFALDLRRHDQPQVTKKIQGAVYRSRIDARGFCPDPLVYFIEGGVAVGFAHGVQQQHALGGYSKSTVSYLGGTFRTIV